MAIGKLGGPSQVLEKSVRAGKIIRTLAAGLLASTTLAGCAATLSLPPYSPTTTMEYDAAVRVEEFRYFPKAGVAANVIHNTAAGEIRLTESVSSYVTNAVRREFRQAGMSLRPESKCKLNGEINDLTLDDLGYSVDYLSDFRYILYNEKDIVLYDNSYAVKFTTDKFVIADVIFASINKMISDNISQLLSDESFKSVLEKDCAKSSLL